MAAQVLPRSSKQANPAIILSEADDRLPSSSPIYNFVQNVRDGCLQIISVMPDLSDEQLRAVHDHSAELESFGWLVRAYARHEFMKRAAHKRGGRGLKDLDEVGRVAMAKKLAVELNVHHTTILDDSLIVGRLLEGEGVVAASGTPAAASGNGKAALKSKNYSDATIVSLTNRPEIDIIPEREYWRIAARSDTPQETLASFAEQKADNPFFNTRDAYRQEKAKKTPPLNEEVPPLIEDESIREWWDEFVDLWQRSPTEHIKRFMSDAHEGIRYEVQRPAESRLKQLVRLIRRGTDELDLVAAEIRQDRVFVGIWLNRMEDDGLVSRFEKERVPGARGAARTGYKLTDKGEVVFRKAQ